jgi:hypothetical protein
MLSKGCETRPDILAYAKEEAWNEALVSVEYTSMMFGVLFLSYILLFDFW